MNEKTKADIRHLLKMRDDYQKLRIASDNRLGKKADGSDQKNINEDYDGIDSLDLVDIKEDTKALEKKLEKKILKELKKVPVYREYLINVKGVGPMLAAVLISEIDIEKASNVSKLWQYAGCNSGLVRGKKKGKDGEIIVTDEWVRGDRLTTGYLAPYNKYLKTKLLGVMADSFIKCKSPYTEFYYNMKERLEHSEKPVNGNLEKTWKDESLAHRNNYARRYMMKQFLIDLYRNWRTIEGLPVRDLYQEEYLGHKHHED